jgi:hypothetical protein
VNGLLLLIARFWQFIAELSSRRQNGGPMRSAAFVRYGGADGMGHVGWAFDLSESEVNAGAVENPLGTPTCDPATMGYWDDSSSTPMASMQQRAYNDLKFIALPKGEAEAEAAYRTAKWVGLQPYCAFGRNCLDDTYDVLRSYGVPNLPLPSRDLLPDKWFIDLDGQIEPVATYVWPTTPPTALQRVAARLARSLCRPLNPHGERRAIPIGMTFNQNLPLPRRERARCSKESTFRQIRGRSRGARLRRRDKFRSSTLALFIVRHRATSATIRRLRRITTVARAQAFRSAPISFTWRPKMV